ncbi:DUF2909 domain-containing protein [Roseateles sp. BYS180W]|uniref:DUF2909 domain-containing protein n=1 Tax=Roseateles rivi TaxID=3299028 RepID=A0ABW7FRI5_9BURK
MKLLIVLALIGVLVAFTGAGYFMLKRGADRGQMARALAWRVGLSIGLFVFILLAYALGWIEPRTLAS